MLTYEIEEAALLYRWSFDRMLTYMPGPGTSPFRTLCGRLQKYGVAPADISIDAPTSKLSEIILSIWLFGSRVLIRISFGWAEMYMKGLGEADRAALLDIGDALVMTLKEIDEEIGKGHVNITSRAHLSLPPYQTAPFLQRYLNATIQNVSPDAFAYKLQFQSEANIQEARITFAKSLVFDNALYIDMAIDYRIEDEPLSPALRFEQDLDQALTYFELQLAEMKQGTDVS